jgi:hypothetical protein
MGRHRQEFNLELLLLWRNLPVFLFVLCAATLAYGQTGGTTPPDGTVCPLSESQTQKSIEAFSKIASAIAKEPRCLGCHGRVNPLMDGIGPDSKHPDAPPSEFEHGPGKVDKTSDCNECHSNMARRTRDGSESRWMTAPDFLAFIGKDAPTLCKQIRSIIPNGKDFLGHIKDDNGGNNFADTAFNGDRGLDRTMFPEKEVPTQKPHITHAALMKLGQDWVASMGGEFKGDKSCGCEPLNFALRYSTQTKISLDQIEYGLGMDPVDIPLTFNDDGTFTGDGAGSIQAGGVAEGCTGQGGLSMKFHITGKAVETSQKQSMHIGIGSPAPMAYNFTGQCPNDSAESIQTTVPAAQVTATYDMKGAVGEAIDKTEETMPGVSNSLHLEIVKRD